MNKISKLLSVVLALAMVMSFALVASAEENNALTSVDELVSGEYYIVCSNGEGLGYLDGSWVLTGDSYAWTVTVTENGVTLQDCNGKFISPKSGNNNGIQEAEYVWAVSCENGLFVFAGQGEDTTKLASNAGSSNKFRAYKNDTIDRNPAGYPYQFTLTPVSGEEEVLPAGPVDCEIPGTLSYTFETDAAASAGVIFRWTATEAGELGVARMGEGYMTSVNVNGSYGTIGENGYVVAAGDVVEITVIAYGAGTVSVPVSYTVAGGGEDAELGTAANPETVTVGDYEKTLESGEYYYQFVAPVSGELTITTTGDGTHNLNAFVNGDQTKQYSNWDNDGAYVKINITEGDVVTFFVNFDYGAGTINFNVDMPGVEVTPTPNPETGDVILSVLSILAVSGMGLTAVISKKR